MWIKNTDGKPDAILTLTLIGFIVVMMKVMFGGTVIEVVGHTTINISSIDASSIGAIFTPTLGAYVMRRYTDKKHAVDTNGNGVIDPEEKVENDEN